MKRVQHIGYTTTDMQNTTGKDREIMVDTSKKVVVVHDAATKGGVPAAREDLLYTPVATIDKAGKMSAAHVQALAQVILDAAANGNAIAQEVIDRTAAISAIPAAISAAISAEAVARDSAIAAAVLTETTNRTAADNVLQTDINTRLLAADYTAANVLAKLLTVDGAGSGIDADKLDGYSSSDFAMKSGSTFVTVGNIAAGATAYVNINSPGLMYSLSLTGRYNDNLSVVAVNSYGVTFQMTQTWLFPPSNDAPSYATPSSVSGKLRFCIKNTGGTTYTGGGFYALYTT